MCVPRRSTPRKRKSKLKAPRGARRLGAYQAVVAGERRVGGQDRPPAGERGARVHECVRHWLRAPSRGDFVFSRRASYRRFGEQAVERPSAPACSQRRKSRLRAPRNAPLRTGRCRVRRLRSSFTIATFAVNPPGERLKPAFSATFLGGRGPRNRGGSRGWGNCPEPSAPRVSRTIICQSASCARTQYPRSRSEEDSAGQRVDNFLIRLLKGVPKSHVYRILRSGEVRVNRGRVGPDARLAIGDVVRVPPVRVAEPSAAPSRAQPASRSCSKTNRSSSSTSRRDWPSTAAAGSPRD